MGSVWEIWVWPMKKSRWVGTSDSRDITASYKGRYIFPISFSVIKNCCASLFPSIFLFTGFVECELEQRDGIRALMRSMVEREIVWWIGALRGWLWLVLILLCGNWRTTATWRFSLHRSPHICNPHLFLIYKMHRLSFRCSSHKLSIHCTKLRPLFAW